MSDIHKSHFPAMSNRLNKSLSNQSALVVRDRVEASQAALTRCQVAIAQPIFNFSVEKQVQLHQPVQEISDRDWEVYLDRHQLHLQSQQLWLSGRIKAEISYIDALTQELTMEQFSLPWKTVQPIAFTYPPVQPKEAIKENVMFALPDESPIYHYVHKHFYNEPTHVSLDWSTITFSEDLDESYKLPIIYYQLDIELACHLFQYQLLSMK
ncbi:hypothetical protein PU629_11055 [Pullulanibacillus sp. KACC 23026]|uniref:hypothetical protein n=1 Tax=Pullulanibacillus sp. KACC 23026 TaxID=3028315 RepID=UPI0023AF9CAD|nr:hypothetical protein [Pullulanibacillus sp. KACC 23026]WEG14844.1 hypothetical protein PU629_11055 [Pullulanibacillus sp. KACC 23026]